MVYFYDSFSQVKDPKGEGVSQASRERGSRTEHSHHLQNKAETRKQKIKSKTGVMDEIFYYHRYRN